MGGGCWRGMNLELTDEQTEALLRELNNIVQNDRYLLSPRIMVLKEILACSDWSRTALRRCRRYAITSRRAKADIGDGGKGPKPTG